MVARILAQKLSETLGQTVLVENRTGASGMIAGEMVAKSASDGYTLMMGTQTTFAVAPTLYRKTTLDPARDFSGIAMRIGRRQPAFIGMSSSTITRNT